MGFCDTEDKRNNADPTKVASQTQLAPASPNCSTATRNLTARPVAGPPFMGLVSLSQYEPAPFFAHFAKEPALSCLSWFWGGQKPAPPAHLSKVRKGRPSAYPR